jgi:hypothetical protein
MPASAVEIYGHHSWWVAAIIWLSLIWSAASCAASLARINAAECTQPAAHAVSTMRSLATPSGGSSASLSAPRWHAAMSFEKKLAAWRAALQDREV